MARVIASDTGPLIALAKLDHLALLASLFDEVLIPPAVTHELGIPLITDVTHHTVQQQRAASGTQILTRKKRKGRKKQGTAFQRGFHGCSGNNR